jgi:hypothetical protein
VRVNERRRFGVGDMVRSLAVVLLFVGFLVLVTHRDHGDGVRTVPWRAIAAQAPAPLKAPADLPDGSRATSARLTSSTRKGLHVGTLTRSGRYVGLEESATTAAAYLSGLLPKAKTVGKQSIGDVTWTRRQSTDDEGHVTRALTRTDQGVTFIVVGTGTWAELTAFVTAARF